MSQQMSTNFDNDMDAFLNFDQSEQTPMSSSMGDVKPIPAMLHDNSEYASNASTFSGPSYQYDSHRQQTGLPVGAYQSTLAINHANGLTYRPNSHGFVMPTQTLNMPLTDLGDFDFSRPQFDQGDMDFENDSPADIPSMFYPNEGQSSVSPVAPIPPRPYPGMHTQQANQAKIQQAQRQQEMIRQQQQQKQLPHGQRPLPTNLPKQEASTPVSKDPHVEESISRLLNRMRQNSTASVDEDDDSPGGMSNLPKFKKDEEDMDEDERLLNSEEGKKLSSKERRQLRNKVSARAFRSRRKEYITQLEAEVAGKAQEANELRVQNRQLMEENTRLTDLTRMLLSSNAFSGFLQELSQSGVPSNIQQPAQRQPAQQQPPQSRAPSQSQSQQSRKDIGTHEAARQMQGQNQSMQVGMTLIPETPIDMSIFDGHTAWNNVIPSNDFQVFSVAELPEPPKLDMSAITEKPSAPNMPKSSKKDLPVLAAHPSPLSSDLYEDKSATVSISIPTQLYTTLSKAEVRSGLLATQTTSSGSWTELKELCEELNDTCDRLSQMMR